MRKTITCSFIFTALMFLVFPNANSGEKSQTPKQTSTVPHVFWCAKTDGNKHIGYCFEKQKQCKDWSRKKFEENGKKLHLCRPTRL